MAKANSKGARMREQGVAQKDPKKEPTNMPVAKTEAAPAASTHSAMSNEWAAGSDISKRDIIIPRILLMQPMSPQVTNGEAKFGELRESLNMELLGAFEKGFDVVPFYMEKFFKVSKDLGKNKEKEFMRMDPITPENETLPYEDEEVDAQSGEVVKILRDRVMSFYVLLKSELELGSAIPYILSFSRTSMTAGRKLTTQMYVKNINSGKNPASMMMHVSAMKQTQDNKTWAILDVKPVAQTPEKMISDAFRWLQLIKTGAAKTHEGLQTE
jgi:hypothetical protein